MRFGSALLAPMHYGDASSAPPPPNPCEAVGCDATAGDFVTNMAWCLGQVLPHSGGSSKCGDGCSDCSEACCTPPGGIAGNFNDVTCKAVYDSVHSTCCKPGGVVNCRACTLEKAREWIDSGLSARKKQKRPTRTVPCEGAPGPSPTNPRPPPGPSPTNPRPPPGPSPTSAPPPTKFNVVQWMKDNQQIVAAAAVALVVLILLTSH
jgi:hypothetical protein